jgi:surfactin synthase thioesterase subunit
LTSYRFQEASPLNCPITAFAARQDDMVYTDEICEWARHTRSRFELIEIDGDHWFLNRNSALIAATLGQIAATIAPDRAQSVVPAACAERSP